MFSLGYWVALPLPSLVYSQLGSDPGTLIQGLCGLDIRLHLAPAVLHEARHGSRYV